MAGGRAGAPKVFVRRHVQDATEKQRDHEKEAAKALSDTAITKEVIRALGQRAPDLAILGGGFYLGAVMGMRPGFELPIVGFVGFPDFGPRIKELQTEIENKEKLVASLRIVEEGRLKRIANCRMECEERRRNFNLTEEQVVECMKACQSEQAPDFQGQQDNLLRLQMELRKHQIAQGILMATITYAVTRAGFLQGVGEIIPG